MNDISPAVQFHLAEYEALRREFEFLNGEMFTAALYAMISIGAVWAWLAINHEKARGVKLLWWLPFMISIVASAWVVLVTAHIRRIFTYLRQIEAEMPRLPRLQGWHTSLQHSYEWWRISSWALWGLIFIITGLGPFYFLRRLEKRRATNPKAAPFSERV